MMRRLQARVMDRIRIPRILRRSAVWFGLLILVEASLEGLGWHSWQLRVGVALMWWAGFLVRDMMERRRTRALKELNRQLAYVNEITEAIRGTVQLEPVLRIILVSLTRELGYDRAFIFLREAAPEGEGEIFQGVIGLGVPRELLTIFRFSTRGEEFIARTARENRSFTIHHAKREPLCDREFAEMLDLEECATVPLEAKGVVVGVLIVERQPEDERPSITQEDLTLLHIFANQAAIAIENAKLYAKVERLSITDGLTGLYNHRYFQEQLAKEWERALRLGESLSLLMLDLDDFKKTNDQLGHQAGDELLKDFAVILRASVRKVDLAARYGGEEFAVLLPGTDHEGAMVFAEKLRARVEEHPFPFRDHQPPAKVTVSVGIATYPEHAKAAKELVALADQALYRAKRWGKNRVVVSGAAVP